MATYSRVSIGLEIVLVDRYVETIASGTDSLLVCRIASYIVFVLLMRPDLAAFVRPRRRAHKYQRHPPDRTSSFRDRGDAEYRTENWFALFDCPPRELISNKPHFFFAFSPFLSLSLCARETKMKIYSSLYVQILIRVRHST